MGKREAKVESYLNEQIEKLDGITRKWISNNPVPDRICVIPGIGMIAVEVKASGGRWSSLGQEKEFERLKEKGAMAYIVYGHDGVDNLITELKGLLNNE